MVVQAWVAQGCAGATGYPPCAHDLRQLPSPCVRAAFAAAAVAQRPQGWVVQLAAWMMVLMAEHGESGAATRWNLEAHPWEGAREGVEILQQKVVMQVMYHSHALLVKVAVADCVAAGVEK